MSYTPTTWRDGDLITAERLNKLEQGVQNEQQGEPGKDGVDGKNATINGQNAVQIVAGDNITIDQSEPGTLKISATGGGGGIALESIEIATPPDRTEYNAGEVFDNTGMVITASYGFGLSQAVSGYTVSPSGQLTGDVTEITISYSEGGITKTATQPITVTRLQASITLEPSTVSLDADTQTAQISVQYTGDGELTAESGNPDIVSAEIDGETLTVTSISETSEIVNVTVSAPQTGIYEAASASITVSNYVSAQIYGAIWDGSSNPAWSRTDGAELFADPQPAVNNGTGSSPFDNIMPWSGMVKVEDPVGGTMVAIPKYWYKWTQSGSSLQLQIANSAQDGFYVSPAHADRGDGQGERDVVYVGRYHCGSDYKSTTGVLPLVNISRATARTNISAFGDEYWQWDWAMSWTIKMLYLVEFANWNSQDAIGYGTGNGTSIENVGYTDAMQYHTGTTQLSRTTYGIGIQYRNIEGLWDNVFDWCDGCYMQSDGFYLLFAPNDYSQHFSGEKIMSLLNGNPSAYAIINKFNQQWLSVNTVVSSQYETYSCDQVGLNGESNGDIRCGGYYSRSNQVGIFHVYSAAQNKYFAVQGTRSMKLPNTAA